MQNAKQHKNSTSIAGSVVPSQREMVQFLLSETQQTDVFPTKPEPIMKYLGLTDKVLSFKKALGPEQASKYRAFLDYSDRTIWIDAALPDTMAKFSRFHEVGHFVLSEHREAIERCSDGDLSGFTDRLLEREANALAAALIFKGDVFTIEANGMTICLRSIVQLAEKLRVFKRLPVGMCQNQALLQKWGERVRKSRI